MCELFLKKKVRFNDDAAAAKPHPTDTPPLAESRRWQKFPPHTPSFLPAC